MKTTTTILFFIITMNSYAQKINPALQKKYLTTDVKGLYIGAPLSLLKKTAGLKTTLLGNYEKKLTTGNVNSITYQTSDNKIYEFIIEYESSYDLYSYMLNKYGEPNDDTEWLFELKDGLKLKIWYYNNKLCIADASKF